MKALRILPALVCMCIALHAHSQDTDTSNIYYEYELIPTDQLAGEDTIYQAFLLIDSLELNSFKKLIILNENQEKLITIKQNDLQKDPAITTIGANYRIAIDYWSNIESWMVIGEKENNSQKHFKNKEKEKQVKHVVIDTPIPVNKSFRSNAPLVNN